MTFHEEFDDVSDDEAYMLTERHAPHNTGECIDEFGPHDDHSDCQRILDSMSNPPELDYMEWEAEAYNRALEEESLGRPLFPNEY